MKTLYFMLCIHDDGLRDCSRCNAPAISLPTLSCMATAVGCFKADVFTLKVNFILQTADTVYVASGLTYYWL